MPSSLSWANKTYPISFPLVRIGFGSQLLDSEKDTNSIANFVDAHLLEHLFIHLEEVLAINVVLPKDFLVFAALDAPKVLAHAFLVPVLDRVGAIGIGEFGFSRAGIILT